MTLSNPDRSDAVQTSDPARSEGGAHTLVDIPEDLELMAQADELGAEPVKEILPLTLAEGRAATGERCETCGNTYDKSFRVLMRGETHVFDCFECAIQKLAPTCTHCGCRIIGHGVEAKGVYYCCAHCAQVSGVKGPEDRV